MILFEFFDFWVLCYNTFLEQIEKGGAGHVLEQAYGADAARAAGPAGSGICPNSPDPAGPAARAASAP